MCGIAGIIGRTPINLEAIQSMISIQTHRGPDGEGTRLTSTTVPECYAKVDSWFLMTPECR
jgi:asparagine synthetase B (glutamine-hydrolysing)